MDELQRILRQREVAKTAAENALSDAETTLDEQDATGALGNRVAAAAATAPMQAREEAFGDEQGGDWT